MTAVNSSADASAAEPSPTKSSSGEPSSVESSGIWLADDSTETLPLIGWRERLALPELGVTSVKAKIDTGARSSALHALDIEFFEREDEPYVRFKVHPAQKNKKKTVTVEAKLLDRRSVRNSGGKAEMRPVIQTIVATRDHQWPIELTLTNRDLMGFRMLLGRQAVRSRFLVDSGRSYLQSQAPKHKLKSRSRGGKSRHKTSLSEKSLKSSQKKKYENSPSL